MNLEAQRDAQRQLSAAAIASVVKNLAHDSGMPISSYTWNLGQGMCRTRHHRLDVSVNNAVVKIYFTDFELLAYLYEKNNCSTEVRLHHLISELRDGLVMAPAVLH